MLTNAEYLKLLLTDPRPEDTLFYHDRALLYTVQHNEERYLISFSVEDYENQTETFLLVQYPEHTHSLLTSRSIMLREFFTHPDNLAHLVIVGYTETGPEIFSAEQYEDSMNIPEEHLPAVGSRI